MAVNHAVIRAVSCGVITLVITLAVLASACDKPAAPAAQPAPSAAQSAGYAGTWVMTLGSRVFMVLTIDQQADHLEARIQCPSSFNLSPEGKNPRYSSIQLPIQERRTSRATIEGDHLRLVVIDPKAPTEPDEFDFVLAGADRGSLSFVGIPVAPMVFTRHTGPAPAVATDWNPEKTYTVEEEPSAPNAEMAQIYEDDQSVRQDVTKLAKLSRADWDVIEKADAERRKRTRALIDAGALHAGADYRKAAFVFQHGNGPDDFLFAHTLALVAMANGDQSAAWIAAATLDRYLHVSHKPQIYGTQFETAGTRTTQGAINRTLVPDAVREQLGVPTLAAQAEQAKAASAESTK